MTTMTQANSPVSNSKVWGWNWLLGSSHLNNLGNWEEKSIRVSPVDCRQLGRKEDQAHNKDLSTHEEPFDVVPLGSYLAKPVSLWMAFFVSFWVLPLELNQGNLDALHHPQEEEDK